MKLYSTCICVVILILSVGCSSVVKKSITQTSVPIPTTTLFTASSTFLPPSATSTLAPLTVLSSEEAKNKLFELLQNNSGCRLPCLLGYTPYATTQEEMKNFFNQFVATDTPDISISKIDENNLSVVGFFVRYSDTYLDIGISNYKNGNQVKALVMDSSSQPKWNTNYAETMKYYMLSQILTNYGVPSQVLVWTFRDDRGRPDVTSWPFFLSIIYPEQGIYVKYEMSRETIGDKFIGCPSKSFVSVAVWLPEDNQAFGQVVQAMNNGGDLSSYKSIDEAANMTMEEFYQKFSNPDNTKCIETPIEMWPNP